MAQAQENQSFTIESSWPTVLPEQNEERENKREKEKQLMFYHKVRSTASTGTNTPENKNFD